MQNNHSCYSRWSWIIALLLALLLLWMLLTGKGPSKQCCQGTTEVASTSAPALTEEPVSTVTEAFNFTASEDSFTGTGDANSISWINDIDALKALLTGGMTAEGNKETVTLSGTVESEEIKLQKELNAQSFFGPDVTIYSKIIVSIPEPIITTPETAKIYFETGVHRLPAESDGALAQTIAWLAEHPDAKAVISGFHDPTGDLASNQKLAKKRAQSVYDALIAGGVAESNIEMRKPESTDGGGDLNEARRVEVSIE